jgi:hypothetical protein
LEQLRKTPLEVAALIEGLSEEAMTRPAPDGGWAIRNVVSHLRDAQGVLDFRIDLFLKEKNPVLEMKQVWTWAKDESERPPSTREIFETYLSTRREVIAKLETIPSPIGGARDVTKSLGLYPSSNRPVISRRTS